ncbi:O-methyltransferase [Paenibacillus sp. Marseille-Q4541]|uniref:O-methyltransferase n=1 Tax=Paenibacillus sp. Marseille-Q4541 TaxID=2831522 RepID=UPI001BAC1B6E|nr:O-methyltransferase [Paenibacillus sp. Marseille-Q4541]
MKEQQNTWEQVDRYTEELLIPHDEVLEAVLSNNQQAGLPAIDVSPSQGKLLQLLIQMKGAARILEIGTLGAYSTIWMARALPQEGKVVTLELDPHHAEVARQNIRVAQLEERIEVRVGDALDQLDAMKKEGVSSFDFIFIDADKPNNPHYLEWALEFAHPGTVIIGDNVIREGKVIDEHEADPRVIGVRTFLELMSKKSRISATVVQTVGVKGYDGFVLGIVN